MTTSETQMKVNTVGPTPQHETNQTATVSKKHTELKPKEQIDQKEDPPNILLPSTPTSQERQTMWKRISPNNRNGRASKSVAQATEEQQVMLLRRELALVTEERALAEQVMMTQLAALHIDKVATEKEMQSTIQSQEERISELEKMLEKRKRKYGTRLKNMMRDDNSITASKTGSDTSETVSDTVSYQSPGCCNDSVSSFGTMSEIFEERDVKPDSHCRLEDSDEVREIRDALVRIADGHRLTPCECDRLELDFLDLVQNADRAIQELSSRVEHLSKTELASKVQPTDDAPGMKTPSKKKGKSRFGKKKPFTSFVGNSSMASQKTTL